MYRILLAVLAAVLVATSGARAQSPDEVVWVQIEAHPNLAEATDRARAYSTLLQDLNGFALGSGWYGIAVGPYRRADAELVLATYKREGLIPGDSFIQLSTAFGQQFWPVGANVLGRGVLDTPLAEPQTPAQPADEPQAAAEPAAPVIEPADESPAEARRSERDLSTEERMELQVALKWAGVYTSGIDGAFGRGTRNAMAAWQEANNYEPTGILTTAQRAALLGQYNAVLDGLGLQTVRDTKAGVEIRMPTATVAFSRYDPPFAHYDASGELQAKVLLISQRGDQATLFGLYDIMQTLEIVPLEGERSRNSRSFTLEGRNARIVSHTEATLQDGEIKGFTLVWPAGDEERRTRLLAEMQKSFARLPGVLDAAAGSNAAQSIDLVSGLEIRKPRLSRSGFFVTGDGAVATTSEAVESCGRITLDGETEADLIASDDTGIAFLRPRQSLAPRAVARFSADIPRLQSEVAVAGYPYEGVLSAAAVTFGTLADLKGLGGETHLSRLALTAQPGDAGGPVFDETGHVVGMLMPRAAGSRELPEDVSFAISQSRLLEAATAAGLSLAATSGEPGMSPRDLTAQARDMTVLVSCWE